MKLQGRIGQAWTRLTWPFRTHIYFHERSRIVVRGFPWKFAVQYHPSLQDQIDIASALGGGMVPVESGIHLIDKPIRLDEDGITLQGEQGSQIDAKQGADVIHGKGQRTTLRDLNLVRHSGATAIKVEGDNP